MIGQTISHYRILAKLGEGGMGVVYKAQDTTLDRTVALKFLAPELTRDPDAKARFIHEAKAAAALSHQNICTIHEIDEFEGQSFIAMECYEGETLKQRIAQGPLPLDEAVDISQQVARGLAKAHDQGIVHRDIKPANIFITTDGLVKVVDFGLAKLAGQTRLTRTGTTLGTVAYMSPEQVKGEEIDRRADLWSLGAVLYEMITGQFPFKGDREQAVVFSILNEEPGPVTGLRTGVPLELERIVEKCLTKIPAERYQTPEGLMADLRPLQRDITTPTVSSRGTVPAGTIGRLTPRWPWVAGLAVVAVVATAILVGVFSPSVQSPLAHRKMLVVLPFENLGPPEDAYFAAGMTEEITSRLASVKSLGVISRKSAVHYAETDKTIKQIGDELDVDYVLEGTVRWARVPGEPGRVRITPQLIRVSDDTHIWADAYEHVMEDVFAIQTEIAQKVVEQLGVALLEGEYPDWEVRPTRNIQAYQAYLQGRFYAGQPHFSVENWQEALKHYQRAVELDPDFALAYAQLSQAHTRFYYFQADHSEERHDWAELAVQKALELAPDSPEVRLALGYYEFMVERDIEQALAEFAIAARELPESEEVLEAKGNIYQQAGRWDEALSHFQGACQLSPRSASAFTNLALINNWMRRYPEAIDASDKAITLAPDQIWPHLAKIFSYWFWKGACEEAREEIGALPTGRSWTVWTWFWQEMYEGRYREALDRLSAQSGEWIRIKIGARPKALFAAHAHVLLKEPELALSAYDSARVMLEGEVLKWPDDPRYHSSLGIAYAALGRNDEAIREGRRSIELLPIAKDALYGIPYLFDLAHIYTILGDYNAAIDQLDYLLSVPSWASVPYLKTDPRWIPLRDQPEFQRLLAKYSGVGS